MLCTGFYEHLSELYESLENTDVSNAPKILVCILKENTHFLQKQHQLISRNTLFGQYSLLLLRPDSLSRAQLEVETTSLAAVRATAELLVVQTLQEVLRQRSVSARSENCSRAEENFDTARSWRHQWCLQRSRSIHPALLELSPSSYAERGRTPRPTSPPGGAAR